MTDKYSDAARADFIQWQNDVQTYAREATRGDKLRSEAAIAAGLVPGTRLYLTDVGGDRFRSERAIEEGLRLKDPLSYVYDQNLVSFPYGRPYSANLAVVGFSITVLKAINGTPPLEGATVSITLAYATGGVPAGTVYTAKTNSLGIASFMVVEGRYNIEASAPGYTTKDFPAVSFGQGGGYILGLEVAPPPPPQSNLLLIGVAAVAVIVGVSYFGKRRK